MSSDDADEILYYIDAACPVCKVRTRFIQAYDSPIPLMQDVPIAATHCPKCGVHIGCVEAEWDVHEESEVQRVESTQNAGIDQQEAGR